MLQYLCLYISKIKVNILFLHANLQYFKVKKIASISIAYKISCNFKKYIFNKNRKAKRLFSAEKSCPKGLKIDGKQQKLMLIYVW